MGLEENMETGGWDGVYIALQTIGSLTKVQKVHLNRRVSIAICSGVDGGR